MDMRLAPLVHPLIHKFEHGLRGQLTLCNENASVKNAPCTFATPTLARVLSIGKLSAEK
jgi:hypothetical protein